MVSMIGAIRNYIASCPYLAEGRILGVDRLGADPVEYSIDTVPCEPVVRGYVDGSSVRQIEFIFGSREAYGQDILQNIMNSGFYEDFSDWIERQNNLRNYPDFGEYRSVQSIEVLTNGYAFEVSTDTSRYQIQLRIKYYQDRRYTKEEI